MTVFSIFQTFLKPGLYGGDCLTYILRLTYCAGYAIDQIVEFACNSLWNNVPFSGGGARDGAAEVRLEQYLTFLLLQILLGLTLITVTAGLVGGRILYFGVYQNVLKLTILLCEKPEIIPWGIISGKTTHLSEIPLSFRSMDRMGQFSLRGGFWGWYVVMHNKGTSGGGLWFFTDGEKRCSKHPVRLFQDRISVDVKV